MKAVEFESTMTQSGQITLPPEILRDIPAGEQLKIVIMWNPSDIDPSWKAAGLQRFNEAYCPEDAVYEQLADGTPVR